MKAEILHVWKALHYSADGLIATFRNETAFRLELIMAVVLIPIALILPLKGIEKVMLIGSVLLVLVVELLNTAVESVVDRVSEETHHLSKKIPQDRKGFNVNFYHSMNRKYNLAFPRHQETSLSK